MYLKRTAGLRWALTGVVSAGLALAPALAAHAQSDAAGQQTPAPGKPGNWGPAGPPPDVRDGQIPPTDNSEQDPNQNAVQGADQGPSQYPGQEVDQDASGSSQYPNANPTPNPNPNPTSGQPPTGYGQRRPAYHPRQNQTNTYPSAQQAPPSGPVTIAAGALLPVRTSEPLDSKRLKPGDYFQGTVAQGIYVGNVLAVPRGAEVTGKVVDVKKAGELKGGASITLQLTSLSLGGNSYSLVTDTFQTNGPGKGGYTAGNTVGTAALGAVIGAIAGGGPGAAIGAAAGTGVGLGASAATPGPRSLLPPEALVTFHLTSPATVQPLPPQDANRMEAESAPPARRYPSPRYGYGPPPPPRYAYAPYPYGYGYPYAYPYAYGYPRGYGRAYYYGRWR